MKPVRRVSPPKFDSALGSSVCCARAHAAFCAALGVKADLQALSGEHRREAERGQGGA